jgi:hypothetical protein
MPASLGRLKLPKPLPRPMQERVKAIPNLPPTGMFSSSMSRINRPFDRRNSAKEINRRECSSQSASRAQTLPQSEPTDVPQLRTITQNEGYI